jgi:DNA-binding NtrC family response regulator
MARILVIDDEAEIRRVLRGALEMGGHEVLEASHGNEALRLHRSTPAELVITDIFMPEIDGFEVIMALRRDDPKLKVIAISGGGRLRHMAVLQSAEQLGAFATLKKPFDLDAMLETVNQALAA